MRFKATGYYRWPVTHDSILSDIPVFLDPGLLFTGFTL